MVDEQYLRDQPLVAAAMDVDVDVNGDVAERLVGEGAVAERFD